MTAPQDLSIRQLQYVVAVADTLGFHRAAEKTHVSQPTLSAQIRELEEVLGTQIFERDRRRVLVTKAGQAIVARARKVLVELDELLRTADQNRDPFAGVLRLGIIPTIAPYLLPDLTPVVARTYPKLRLALREEKTRDAADDLRQGKLDGAIVALDADGLEGFAHETIAIDPFVAAMPRGHRLAKKKRVRTEDLDHESVLLLDDGHCFREQALALCAKSGAREADLRATSLSTLVQMVSSGGGLTLLPSLAVPVENRRAQLEVRPFATPVPTRTIALVWRPESALEPALRELAKTFRHAVHHAARGRSTEDRG